MQSKTTNVLVVEDDQIQRNLLSRRLEKLGYRVIEAENGEAACKCIDSLDIDVAIVDWELPDINGPDIIAKYSKDEHLLLPFIMLTAHNEPEKISYALDCGAFDFIKKPANKLELEARLRSALKFRNLQKKYLELAIRDPLTGLFNRRHLDHQMAFVLANTAASGEPLTICIVDIDFFKKVNDTYGHDIGDIVIRQMAQLLSSNLRVFDFVCRIGGEEFVVVLPSTSKKQADSVMKRLLEQARARNWGSRDQVLKLPLAVALRKLLKENFILMKS